MYPALNTTSEVNPVRDELLDYYERELTFLRGMGAEFAEKYPKIAARLVLEPDRCEDPHVERMLEAFAFLAARVHLKIDDDFPEITESLLGILYPHYIQPIPSMSVVEFHLDRQQGKLSTGFEVPRSTILYSKPVDGVPCKFRTGLGTTMWPLRVQQAQWRSPERLDPPLKAPDAVAACSIQLGCDPDIQFSQLQLRALRFYLNGESNLIHTLYELLFNNCTQILVRDPEASSRKPALRLDPTALRAMGFQDDEALLEYPRRSFTGYRVLQEYFAFPEKFFFFELSGLEQLAAAGFGPRAEVIFLVSPHERSDRQQMLELGVSAKTFRLNCAPVINLFPHTAEPIHLDQTRHEYAVMPDVRRKNALEVISVDEALSSNPRSQEIVRFDPIYSYRHTEKEEAAKAFWKATRRPSGRKNDEGSEVWISLVDLAGRTARPGVEALTVHCTCSNRDLPSRLPFGNEAGDFEMEGVALVQKIVALRKPTATLRPAMGAGRLWRLISHLSLNYLSLVEEGKEALQEILRLYNFSGSTFLDRQIAGIDSVGCRRAFARVLSEHGISFARGTRVDLELDEEQFVGGGAFLFGAVLEYFLGLYVTMNGFSQLSVRTRQRKEALKQWPPRAGHRILL
jgi:type VI secretion system protein ImpG